MRLDDLNVSDVFFWEGKKYTIFLKLKKDFGIYYLIPCLEYPMLGECVDMPSNRIVKPVVRV